MTTVLRPRLAGLVAAALAAAAGLVGLSSAPASAAVCSSTGISSVVDFNDGAGGGIRTACNKVSGSKKAAAVFGATGVHMTRNRDGSVCQVNGKPAGADCVQLGSRYWGLWWSNGKDHNWVYSQQGVDTLTVPKNGSVAWAWQGSSGRRNPGVAPPVIKASPAPTKSSTKAPPKGSGGGQGGGSKATTVPKSPEPTKAATRAAKRAAASATPSPARSRSPKHSASASASPSASASATASPSAASSTAADDASPAVTSTEPASSDFTPDDENGGLPAWVPIGVIVVLAGAAGAAVWWRKRTGAV
jgi:hypothetical protein